MLVSASIKSKPSSLWFETAEPAAANPPLQGNETADVTLIGAGFTGLRAALCLAEAGSRVVVLDAGDVGWGASGRTGGQVNPMLPFNTPDALRGIVGKGYFERLTETSLGSADEVFSLIKTYQIQCQARQHGWLRVDHSPKAKSRSWATAQKWNEFGAGMVQVDHDEVKRLSGSAAYASGVVAPKGGAVQPLSLAQGLAQACKDRGVQIYGKSAVAALDRTDNKWIAHTATGSVTSDWVVIATNGYSDSLLPGLSDSIIPLVPIQIATDTLNEDQIGHILPQGHTISDTRRVIMYARREPEDRFVIGGLGSVNRRGDVEGFDWLVKDAERIFPSLKGVNWSVRWGGQIAVTADRVPHLHEPRPGLIAGLGYNGRGVAMSHVMGRIMAERILGAAPEALPFPVSDVRKIPFRGVQMMGKGMAVRWMRFLDYLESR